MRSFKLPNRSRQRGFTLVELMVAIGIVAILGTIGIVVFSGSQIAARDAKRKGDLEDVRKALYVYRSSANTFCPAGVAGCATTISGNFGSIASLTTAIGSSLKGGVVPVDPKGASYPDQYYAVFCSDDKFSLYANLEGAVSGSTAPTCALPAGTSGSWDYVVTE